MGTKVGTVGTRMICGNRYIDMRGTNRPIVIFFMKWFPEPYTLVHETQGDKVMFPGNRAFSLWFYPGNKNMVPDSKTIFLSSTSQNVTSSRAGRQDVSYMKLIFMKPFISERFRIMNFMKYFMFESSFVG